MTATRSVVGRPQHQKGLSVCWTRACDGGGGNDLLWLPQARERPFDASKSSLEPDIRYRNDFAETTSQAPFYDAGEQGQRCLVNGTISPPLPSPLRGVDAKARTLDHQGIGVQAALREQRRKYVYQHGRSHRRQIACTSCKWSSRGDIQDGSRGESVNPICLALVDYFYIPNASGKDPRT